MDDVVLLLQIILINLVLSGDNAVVIALASRHLPSQHQKRAIWLGTFAAIGMRIILTAVAMYLFAVPYIQAVGAVLLLYIAFKLLSDQEEENNIRKVTTLASAVWTILLADFIMSLDNVLAVAAIARGHMVLLILGVALSIPLMIWGATWVLKLLQQLPMLVYAGAGVLGYTAGEMLLSDKKLSPWFSHMHASIEWVLPISCLVVVIVGGWIGRRIA